MEACAFIAAFCSAESALYVPTDECRVCDPCAARIARLAAAATDEIWTAKVDEGRERNVEAEELAARVAKQVAPSDVDSHFHLAMAYRAMGLHGDALREAATALKAASDASRTAAVLRLLLTPPLLRDDGVAKLRQRITGMTMN